MALRGVGAGRREQSLFPLPRIVPPIDHRRHASCTNRQRARFKARVERTAVANRAITALNALSISFSQTIIAPTCTTYSHPPASGSTPHSSPSTSAAQQRLTDNVVACARRFVHRASDPSDRDACGEQFEGLEADDVFGFRQFDGSLPMHTSIGNGYSKSTTAVPLVADRVALPDVAGAVDLLGALPPSVASYYESPRDCVRHDDTPTTAPRARVFGSRREYIKLLQRMAAVGMLTYTTTPKVVVGLFGVEKDDGMIRLIVDGRPTNAVFESPPHVDLPTPDLFARLEVPAGKRLLVAKTDLSDFFFRFRIPSWMHAYFALPAVRADEIGMQSEYGSVMIHPCLAVLAMGWSHSVFVAQSAHEHLLNTATRLQPCDRITQSSDLRLDRPRHALYVDDLIQMAVEDDREVVTSMQDEYVDVAIARRLPVKARKIVTPRSDGVECLGFEVHGTQLTVGVSPRKLRTLCDDTRSLIAQRHTTGRELATIVGRWTWAMLARRPALATFNAVYRYVKVADRRAMTLWTSVVIELRTAIALAPLLFTSIAAPFFRRVMACDASLDGQGVCVARVPSSAMAMAAAHSGLRGPLGAVAERAASRTLSTTTTKDGEAMVAERSKSDKMNGDVLKARPKTFEGPQTRPSPRSLKASNEWRRSLRSVRHDKHSHLIPNSFSNYFDAFPPHSVKLPGTSAIPRFSVTTAHDIDRVRDVRVAALRPTYHRSPDHSANSLVISPSSASPGNSVIRPTDGAIDGPLLAADWTTIVAAPWHGEEHINSFEVRSISTAVRWVLSTPVSIGRRLLVLSDSQVAVGALSKGRSSSPLLLRRLRPIAAAVLASGLQLFVRWIPSAVNPADEPSRRFSRGDGGGEASHSS
jgi:hypothetical protein